MKALAMEITQFTHPLFNKRAITIHITVNIDICCTMIPEHIPLMSSNNETGELNVMKI